MASSPPACPSCAVARPVTPWGSAAPAAPILHPADRSGILAPLVRRPRADREEKLVTHGRDRGTRIGLTPAIPIREDSQDEEVLYCHHNVPHPEERHGEAGTRLEGRRLLMRRI